MLVLSRKGKEMTKQTTVSLKNIVTIKGYTPDGKDSMYVIGVGGKLESQKVVGFSDKKAIRSLVSIARVQDAQDEALVGPYVILADKKFVSMVGNPFTRKQALAMIHMLNVRVSGETSVELKSILSDNVEELDSDAHAIRLDAARLYGYKPMKKAVEKQNGTILKSMHSSANALRKMDKKAARGTVQGPVADEPVQEVVIEAEVVATA